MSRVRIKFKHWKTDKLLEVEGERVDYNSPQSDRYLILKENGAYEDIIKETIVEINEID
jgi:hypothetical protein